MSPELSRRAEPPGLATPPASLTAVKVSRRRRSVEAEQPKQKRGDLTQKLASTSATDNSAEEAAPLNQANASLQPEAVESVLQIQKQPVSDFTPASRLFDGPIIDAEVSATPLDADETSWTATPVEEEDPLQSEQSRDVAVVVASDTPQTPSSVAASEQSHDVERVVALPRPTQSLASARETVEEFASASSYASPRGDDEIVDYWDGLRGDRSLPTLRDVDRAYVARCWPNSLILAVGESETNGSRIMRLGDANGDIEYTPMVIDWILSRGRQSARRIEPMEDEQRFPVSRGSARYRLLLLPLGAEGSRIEHVLCLIGRGQELSAGAAFKRWLAS